jgi:hypothetical protein
MHGKFITKLEADLEPVLATIEARGLIMDIILPENQTSI